MTAVTTEAASNVGNVKDAVLVADAVQKEVEKAEREAAEKAEKEKLEKVTGNNNNADAKIAGITPA